MTLLVSVQVQAVAKGLTSGIQPSCQALSRQHEELLFDLHHPLTTVASLMLANIPVSACPFFRIHS